MAQEWAKNFYNSKAWKQLRMQLIIKRGPVCQHCNKLIADTSRLVGHHKVKLTADNITDPKIALNPDNIDIICDTCHNKEHNRFCLNEHNIYIVYGSPCSGKTSLANQLRSYGDLIVDMDLIYQAISGCARYDKPNNLKMNVFRVRDLLIDQIRTRYGRWDNAYIVGGYPRKAEREELAMKLHAQLIYCEATKEECLSRTTGRKGHEIEWQTYIEKWWNVYTACG